MGVSISISVNLQHPSSKYLSRSLEILVLLREQQRVTDRSSSKGSAEISFLSICSLMETDHRVSFFRKLKPIASEGFSIRQPVSFKEVNNSAEKIVWGQVYSLSAVWTSMSIFFNPNLHSQSYPFIYKPRRQNLLHVVSTSV